MIPGAIIQRGLLGRGLPDLAYPIYWSPSDDGEDLEGLSPLNDIIENDSFLYDTVEGFSFLNDGIEKFSGLI